MANQVGINMPKMSQSKKIGLSFGPQESFLVTADCSPVRITITHLIDIDLGAPFLFDTISDFNTLEAIGQNLKDTLQSENITAEELYVSIDSSMTMIRNLPADGSLKDSEMKDHVLWEMEQHSVSPIPDYNYDFQKIPKAFASDYPSLLLVSVKKEVIDALKSIAETAGLNLNVIDVNVFSALNTLEKNYPLKTKEKIVSVGIARDSLLFTVMRGNNFLGFHPVPLENDSEDISVENIYNEITKNLRFFVSDYETEDGKKEFDRIFVYKTDKTVPINDLISIESESPFEIINPLKKMSISPKLKERMDPLSDNSEYTTSVGLIVRD